MIYAQINAFGLFVLLLMLFSIKRNLTVRYGEKIFIKLIVSLAVILIIDAVVNILNGSVFLYARILLIIINTIYSFILGLISLYWMLYLDYSIYSDKTGLNRRKKWYRIPVAVILTISIINLFTKWIFYIDANNIFIKGQYYGIMVSLLWIMLSIPSVIAIHKAIIEPLSYRRREYIIEALYILPPLIGWILQYYLNLTPIMWMLAVASMLLNFLEIQGMQISLDALTGINNRRTFNRYIETFVGNPKQKESLYLLIIDVNDFKLINDTYGHVAGDDALVSFASILKKICGQYHCFLARYGGDEFAVICIDTDEKQINDIIVSINSEIELINNLNEKQYKLSCSIGCSILRSFEAADINKLISDADRDMYAHKNNYKHAKLISQQEIKKR